MVWMSLENGYFRSDKRSYESYGSGLRFRTARGAEDSKRYLAMFSEPTDHESHYSLDGHLKNWPALLQPSQKL